MEYDAIIGLEIHAELKTKSKMFCSCNNDAEGKKPNTVVCPICLGHPGTLPTPNKQAIEWTILLGQALHCKINQISKFDRKNYFYPDLPKAYQISQYDMPFCINGYLELDNNKVAITRIHLEEDTAKLTHPQGKNHSLIDFNRAGTPLVEMVTEPVIKDANEAKEFCQKYQQILRYLDISNADMEKGEMRCEANVSVQAKGKWKYNGNCEIKPIKGYVLNPKVEVKNINSFKAVAKAIDYEIKRQIKALAENTKLVQETRGWDEKKSKTIRQRIKETSADYRYFPEPDIPPIKVDAKWSKTIISQLGEMPGAKQERFRKQYNFSKQDAALLVSDEALANYTEKVISELRAWIDSTSDSWERQKNKLAKIAANWLLSELFKHLKEDNKSIKDIYPVKSSEASARSSEQFNGVKITPENFAELITLIYQDKINSSAGQTILAKMYAKGGDPTNIMADMGLEQMDNESELEEIIKGIIAKNTKQVEQYRKGKETVLQFFVGQTMAVTKGKANPKIVIELLKKLLSK